MRRLSKYSTFAQPGIREYKRTTFIYLLKHMNYSAAKAVFPSFS